MKDITIFPADIAEMSVGQLAALTSMQKAEIDKNLDEALDWLKKARTKFDAALDAAYGEQARAALRDSGRDFSLETTVVKLQVARAATEICHKAVQILGGHGYMKHNPLERYARDARLMDIGVGASEVLKMVVGGAVARQYSQKPTG